MKRYDPLACVPAGSTPWRREADHPPLRLAGGHTLLAALLCGMWLACSCAGLYRSTVALTAIVDDAAKQYAHAYNQGLVPPDIAAKVSAAHLQYRRAAGVAHDVLVAYKLSGDATQFNAALDAAKVAADGFVVAVMPFLVPDKAARLKTQIKSATKL